MTEDTGTFYTPRWKDKNDNRIIFAAPNTLFTDEGEARDWQIGEFIFMIPFGLSPDGVLEFEAMDGKTEIPHRKAKLGMLGECCVIAGPLFDECDPPFSPPSL